MLNGNCGSQGVAIALSQEGVIAEKAAGSELSKDFGTIHNKDVSVFFHVCICSCW